MRDFSNQFGKIHAIEQVVIERLHDRKGVTEEDIATFAKLKEVNPDAYEMAVDLAYHCSARVEVYPETTGVLGIISDYEAMVEAGKIPTDEERNYSIIEKFMKNPRNAVFEAMMDRSKK